MLANAVKMEFGIKVRGIELSLLQRCAAHVASQTDIDEAVMAGQFAVEAATAGYTDKMVAFHRSMEDGTYECKMVLQPLDIVANLEKKVPRSWINEAGNGVTQEFIDYVLPLIQGDLTMPREHSLPRLAKLKKIFV